MSTYPTIDHLTVLKKAQSAGDLHHAYLCVGGAGSKKIELLEEFIALLGGVELVRCSSSTDEDGRNVPISIDKVREIKKTLVRIPGAGIMRVIWIEPAEALTQEAANALLKMLEEPPPQTLYLLFAQSARGVLGTVRSRCHILRMPAPRAKEVHAEVSANLQANILSATGMPFSQLDIFEHVIRNKIRAAVDTGEYAHTVRMYEALTRARAARQSNVGEQACIDMAYI